MFFNSKQDGINMFSKFFKTSLALCLLTASVGCLSLHAHQFGSAQCKAIDCGTKVERKINNNVDYKRLYDYLTPFVKAFETRLLQTVDQLTYQSLLDLANNVAANVPNGNGRIIVVLADGTVVVDTSKNDGVTFPVPQPNTSNTYSNSYTNFQQKNVNENHNSRIAVIDAQLWPCGLGVETKFSTSSQQNENYVAIRLGKYLNNAGTVRISQTVAVP